MISENPKKPDFKDKILLNFEFLLQLSLLLTKNGRDAAKLMREAMAEAFQSWEHSIKKESSKIWLHTILTRQSFGRFQTYGFPIDTANEDNFEDNTYPRTPLGPAPAMDNQQNSPPVDESFIDIIFIRAIAGLPEMYRPAMMLSYIEGFTNTELACLAEVQQHAIESLLNRGIRLRREELFERLMETTTSRNFPTERRPPDDY